MDGTPMRSRFSSFAVSALYLFGSLLFAAFHIWLVLNWLLGCCARVRCTQILYLPTTSAGVSASLIGIPRVNPINRRFRYGRPL